MTLHLCSTRHTLYQWDRERASVAVAHADGEGYKGDLEQHLDQAGTSSSHGTLGHGQSHQSSLFSSLPAPTARESAMLLGSRASPASPEHKIPTKFLKDSIQSHWRYYKLQKVYYRTFKIQKYRRVATIFMK